LRSGPFFVLRINTNSHKTFMLTQDDLEGK